MANTAAGSSSVSPKTYDVFLCFRGEDTRENFTCHLSAGLVDEGIEIYKYDDQLVKGCDIWTQISLAIEGSRVSVVVFSQDFASSKWCLEELVKIMECRRDTGQVVIPVFYNIDPAHVRYQKESYKKSFARHEWNLCKNQQKIRRWREALTEAANLAGWVSGSPGIRDDSELIRHIVKDVLQKLKQRRPNTTKYLVGIEKTQKDIEMLLQNAKIIGIWGPGGIGKTTIGKVVYNKLSSQYDSVCLMENISEETRRYGLPRLCRNLFSDLLKEDNPTHNVRRLQTKKALIVFDDVDSFKQLEYLCEDSQVLSYLGEDSRVIITSRNRHLLANKADEIYEVKNLNLTESLKLFSLKAFSKSYPEEGYEKLSKQVVEYTGGIPLALNVLGSHLSFRLDKDFWESTMRKLENSPNEDIQKVLRVSYDGLDSLQQKIFLDIAFFFIEEEEERVKKILHASGFEPNNGLLELKDKALISTTSYDSRIQMHGLLQEMALDIVRRESELNPGGRSRLRDVKDIRDVLENNTGTNAVEGIVLDLSQIEDLQLSADVFEKMNRIRFLKFYIPRSKSSSEKYLPEGLTQFPKELRYLQWDAYPLKSLPLRLCFKFLVEIHMRHSNVEELWQGKKDLHNLEVIDLCECRKLMNLPDLSNASRLRTVNLSGCEMLHYLHPTVLSAGKLATLILDRCKNLMEVKSEKRLESLEKISVNGCLSLKEFEVWSSLIEKLDLSKTEIETLHTSIGHMENLRSLNLEGLKLKHLPNALSGLKSLKYLNLSRSGVEFDKHQLHVLFNGLQSLEKLHVTDCSNLFELPDNINVLQKLQELRLDGSSIVTLPESIKHLRVLKVLSLENCNKLVSVPELPPSITVFNASNCTSLVSVSVSTLRMMGKTKCILFKDSLKLDKYSLPYSITESLHLTMMSAAFHNVLVRVFDNKLHNYNYVKVRGCLPGSRVSRHFKNRTRGSTITIRLPSCTSVLGFLLSVVISPGVANANIYCRCYSADGTPIGEKTRWYSVIESLNSDNVFMWYDPYFSDSILKLHETHVSFKFYSEEGLELDIIKECGVHVIGPSEFQSVLGEMDLEYEQKVELGVKLGLALDIQRQVDSNVDLPNLLFAFEYGWKLQPPMQSELESRRRAMADVIRKQMWEFIFPPCPAAGMWGNITQDFEDR
ncbi:hypothetical protein AHAS_Ahas09G0029100 [Arachis hypogaea]